jgi:hypothetical protein
MQTPKLQNAAGAVILAKMRPIASKQVKLGTNLLSHWTTKLARRALGIVFPRIFYIFRGAHYVSERLAKKALKSSAHYSFMKL